MVVMMRKVASCCRSYHKQLQPAMFCLADYEEKAKGKLDKGAWDYYSSGANQQQSLRDNVEAFSRYVMLLGDGGGDMV